MMGFIYIMTDTDFIDLGKSKLMISVTYNATIL